MLTVTLIVVVLITLVFDFINGFHDTANAIATSVATKVLKPRQAVAMAAILNFVGALVSQNVAKTISGDIVNGSIEEYVIIAALLAAITWDLVTWYLGIPCSSSHALIGSLIGAAMVYASSFSNIRWEDVVKKVVIPLFTSPIAGFVFGYLIMTLLYKLLKPLSLGFINKLFSKLQIFSAAFMAYSHGSNDAQKSMGIITLALISAGFLDKGANIPLWVKAVCAIAMALGTSVGGWKIIKTVGVNLIRLRPVGGFAAETGAAIIIQIMTAMGAPVSTTHVISTSIMGVGASKRLSAVRWSLARNIVSAWFLTIPVTMALGAVITFVIQLVFV